MVQVQENGAGDSANKNNKETKTHDELVIVGERLGDLKIEAEKNSKEESGKKEEKKKNQRQVVVRGVSGKIKWFNVGRGYGFIERNDQEQDVFLHQSAVVRKGRKLRYSMFLKGGEDVEFDVVEGLKGLEAAAVSAPGGFELYTHNPRFFRKNGPEDQKRRNPHRRPYSRQPYKNRKNNKKQSDDSEQKDNESNSRNESSSRNASSGRNESSGRRRRNGSKDQNGSQQSSSKTNESENQNDKN